MKAFILRNFRKGPATNSSSTHSVFYKKTGEMLEDLNVMEENFYDRYTNTIAATREAKIKYVAANIMYNDVLFNEMCLHYPEMAKYKGLIEKQKEKEECRRYTEYPAFGMYDRGDLFFRGSEYLEASIDFLKYVIDSEDVIIIGGSDEQDFFYDEKEEREEVVSPLKYIVYKKDSFLVKNGNYWVGYGFGGSRVRMSLGNYECIPKYPELIDIKVTDMCHHNCPFCYAGSSSNGKHADYYFIHSVIEQLSSNDWYKSKVEFAIGGGNPLEYPQLKELLKYINEKGHIANITINAADCVNIDVDLLDVICDTVSGIGVSITKESDIENLLQFKHEMKKGKQPKIVCHLIPEMLGAEKTNSIVKTLRGLGFYDNLFLGFKTCGRGKNIKYSRFTDDDLDKLFDGLYYASVDTTFANTYKDWIQKNGENTDYTITYGEGEFSMFIDAVEETASKSSYQTDKKYNLKHGSWDDRGKTWFAVTEAFNLIRKDNGFKVFE